MRLTVPSLLILAVIAVLLAGCGYYRWQKPGANQAAFQRESAECQAQASGQWEACMNGRGWHYAGGMF
jgi:hypothetical protein